MEGPGRDDAAVVGGGADVVDRVDLGGQRLCRAVGRFRRRAAGPRALPSAAADPDRRRSATEPSATRTSRQDGSPARSCQATAITTLLIACARRVPTLRKRASRPPPTGIRIRRISSSGARAVSAVRDPEVARRRPSARRAARPRRSPRRARAGPAACRRPARRWRRCRRACPGSGSGPRRSSPRPRRAPAGARGRRPSGGSRCTSSARRARWRRRPRVMPRSSSSRHRSSTRSGGSPISPVIWTIRSVPPATA